MNGITRLPSLLASAIGLLTIAVLSAPPTGHNERSTQKGVKFCVKIEVPETIAEAVEHQSIDQLENTKNVSLVTDSDSPERP